VAGGAPSGARSEYLVALPGAKRRRLWLGFELEEFVGASGISLPTLRKAERGEPVREGTAIKIARALDTTVEELSRG
jgi:transcriptional regulator with XRE-family HTH domain